MRKKEICDCGQRIDPSRQALELPLCEDCAKKTPGNILAPIGFVWGTASPGTSGNILNQEDQTNLEMARLEGWEKQTSEGLAWNEGLHRAKIIRGSSVHQARIRMKLSCDDDSILPDYLQDLNAIRRVLLGLSTERKRYLSFLLAGWWKETQCDYIWEISPEGLCRFILEAAKKV